MTVTDRVSLPLALAIVLLGPALCRAQESRPAAPDLTSARQEALRTRARLKREAATWRAVIEAGPKRGIAVDVLATPAGERRIVYLLHGDAAPREVARIVIQPDAWYVSEAGGARGIYRPRQVPFAFSRAYAILRAADLRYVGKGSPGELLGVKAGRATYRRPLPRARRARLEERIRKLERIARASPGKADELKPRLKAARLALVRGRRRTLDLKTGVLVAHGQPGSRVRIARFAWRKSFALTAFAIEDGKGPLPDRRALPARAALLAHCGQWRRGSAADELDARLVDLKTGALRRVPYRGSIALPGCLLPGQDAAVVCGQDAGGVGLYRVDLKTGANTRLGGAPLRRGVCFSPALAPDGKTLAVLHLAEPRRPRAQVYLCDLQGGEAKPLGKSLPTTGLDWFPDGRALLLDRRVQFLPGKPSTSSLARLDRGRGTLRILREGEAPRLVAGAKPAILFRDGKAWKLCDLDGGNPRALGDGLAKLNQPAVAPDGKQALFLEERAAGPRPFLVDLTTGAAAPLPLEQPQGLWGFPAW